MNFSINFYFQPSKTKTVAVKFEAGIITSDFMQKSTYHMFQKNDFFE